MISASMRFDHLGIVVPNLQIGRDRNEKEVQTGHSFDIHFNMRVVNDELVYEDESKKSLGYEILEGQYKLQSDTFKLTKGRGTVKKKD